ncbi:MAG: hypothetical protein AB7Q17_11010 [Phycisphaerae bacterium]
MPSRTRVARDSRAPQLGRGTALARVAVIRQALAATIAALLAAHTGMAGENAAPVAKCRPANVATQTGGCAMVTVAHIDDRSYDPDGPADLVELCIVAVDGEPVPCSPQIELCGCGSHTVTLRAADAAGASSTCDAAVLVRDETPPTIVCPPAIVVERGEFLCDTFLLDWLGSATALDDCDPDVTLTHDAPACGFASDSVNTVTWTSVDAAGNVSTCSATVTVLPAQRTSFTQKGSLLIYPAVEVRFDRSGNVVADTFVSLANDYHEPIAVQLYFVHGDPPLTSGGQPGWNRVDNRINLTPNQPLYWSAATGQPAGVSPWAVLDPSNPPGRPDGDVPGDYVIRGYVLAWAVDSEGREIRWNHLTGGAIQVDYARTAAWDYNAWAYQSLCGDHGAAPRDCVVRDAGGVCCEATSVAGQLDLDGFQYDFTPDQLLLDFFASELLLGGLSGEIIRLDTELTLVPAAVDLRQDGVRPVSTNATFDLWNQNEVRFSGQTRCVACWDQLLLSLYPAPTHFLLRFLQTERGKARIDGGASDACAESVDTALLGVAARVWRGASSDFFAISGAPLVGQGRQTARILYDLPRGSGEAAGRQALSTTGKH